MNTLTQYSNLSILQHLLPEDQELLLSMAEEVAFNAEEIIIRDSDLSADFYVLLQGWITIELEIADIDVSSFDADAAMNLDRSELPHKVEATVLRAGEPFGDMAFLERKRRSADVRALTPVTALKWNADDLNTLFESNYRLGYLFMRNLATLLARRIRDVDLKWRRAL
ncbi:MAG: cyclic nucleotide-binding domain-containing protein [Prochlorotrichaceae cyanobacterium]